MIRLDRIADAKAVLDQAKRKGAQGYNFDQTEKRLSSSNSANFNAQEPSQQQLQSLISLHKKGQYQESKNQSLQLLKKFSGSVTLYNILGAANHSLGNLDAAVEAFQKALSIMPNYSDAYSNMGVTLEEQGKLDEAIAAYSKALSIKPDYAEAHINIGNVLKKQGKLDEAIEAATTLSPSSLIMQRLTTTLAMLSKSRANRKRQ